MRILLRRLAASSGFATISVMTLAIGISANIAKTAADLTMTSFYTGWSS